MKKLFLFLILLILSVGTISQAQTFDFCQNYTSEGMPIGSYKSFECNGYNSCYVYGLLNLFYRSSDSYIIYEVYKVSGGREIYYDTYTLYTKGHSWSWCAMKMTFYSSGHYYVYIYTKYSKNSNPNYIGKAEVYWIFY
jgi:hypothetical protein